MIPRILEPEAMDTPEEVLEYERMDHSEVNDRFVADFLKTHGPCRGGEILDVGTGTARIPISLCRADPGARIVALDLAPTMLEQAGRNIVQSGLADRIRCIQGDVKDLDPVLGSTRFEAVISNTILHHIPAPAPALKSMIDRVAPGGRLMIRDLARPQSSEAVARLVLTYAGEETKEAQKLYEASLNAALTVQEVREIVSRLGLPTDSISMTSDRHWTLIWQAGPSTSHDPQPEAIGPKLGSPSSRQV